MESAAENTFVGAAPPEGVAAVNSGVQALVAELLAHVASASASAASLPGSIERFEATVAAVPVEEFASNCASSIALRKPAAFVLEAPMFAAEEANCDSVHAAAAVVSGLTAMVELVVKAPQLPRAVTSVIAVFEGATVVMGLPPLETT